MTPRTITTDHNVWCVLSQIDSGNGHVAINATDQYGVLRTVSLVSRRADDVNIGRLLDLSAARHREIADYR